MRRITLVCAVLLIGLGTALAAAPVEVSLAYPVAVDAPITAMLKGWAQDYMAKNPNVKVNLVFSGGYPDVKTAVQTAIQGGAKPPTLAVMLATDVYDLVNAKYVDSLDDLVAQAPAGACLRQGLPAGIHGQLAVQGQAVEPPLPALGRGPVLQRRPLCRCQAQLRPGAGTKWARTPRC